MVFVTAVDKALRTNEGIVASFANIHNGVFGMPVASSLEVTVMSIIDQISPFLSDHMLSI
jgi:hypothetical protein